MLIDGGASRQGAQKLDAAVKQATDPPVRWVINTGHAHRTYLGLERE